MSSRFECSATREEQQREQGAALSERERRLNFGSLIDVHIGMWSRQPTNSALGNDVSAHAQQSRTQQRTRATRGRGGMAPRGLRPGSLCTQPSRPRWARPRGRCRGPQAHRRTVISSPLHRRSHSSTGRRRALEHLSPLHASSCRRAPAWHSTTRSASRSELTVCTPARSTRVRVQRSKHSLTWLARCVDISTGRAHTQNLTSGSLLVDYSAAGSLPGARQCHGTSTMSRALLAARTPLRGDPHRRARYSSSFSGLVVLIEGGAPFFILQLLQLPQQQQQWHW